ncbi:MAG: Arylsulfate sulfotransferase AssT [Bacteroidota bacterium]|nr:Arylsulfate sulfotransferase AssT [Bacteroidota bacterium]
MKQITFFWLLLLFNLIAAFFTIGELIALDSELLINNGDNGRIIPEKDSKVYDNSKLSKDNDFKQIIVDIPPDFPVYNIDTVNDPSPYNLFLANYGGSVNSNYLIILNNKGLPVAFKRLAQPGFDFKVQPNGLISNSNLIPNTPLSETSTEAAIFLYDNNLKVIDTIQCGNDLYADFHDFKLLPNGHFLLISYETIYIDMSKIVPCGCPNAEIIDVVLQELDGDKKPVFQWRAIDHLPITDSYIDLTQCNLDPFHTNSIDMSLDGNILISNRHQSQIVKIDRKTGNIIWKLGGKSNEFTFLGENDSLKPTYFSYQHDVKMLNNGNITLFDNGNQHTPKPYSRGVEYMLDEQNKTCELVWEYRHIPRIFSTSQGSMQRLPNGNSLIGWGEVAKSGLRSVTEVHPDNSLAFELTFQNSPSSNIMTYRAYKYQYPTGLPSDTFRLENPAAGILYNFKNSINDTWTKIKLLSDKPTGDGSAGSAISVQRFEYAPLYPKFMGEAPYISPDRIYISSENIESMLAEIRFDASKFKWMIHPGNFTVFLRPNPGAGTFNPLTTTYDESADEYVVTTDKSGEFIFGMSEDATLPLEPYLIYPADNSIIDYQKPVELTWNTEGVAPEYILQIAVQPEFNPLITEQKNLRQDNFHLTDIYNGITYYWRVKALNGDLESPWSEIRRFTAAEPYINKVFPNGSETVYLDTAYQIVRWETNVSPPFRVELYKNDTFSELISENVESTTGACRWLVADSAYIGDGYKIKVKSRADTSLSGISENYFNIKPKPIVDVPSHKRIKLHDIEIYPNPGNDIVNIDIALRHYTRIKVNIFSMEGIEIGKVFDDFLTRGNFTIQYDCSGLAQGEYLIYIDIDGERYIEKLVVM